MAKIVDETQRQNEIADAAVRVFAENGFSGTPVKRIAEEADIAPGSIYRYFDSKSDILYHVFMNFQESVHDLFDRVISSSDDPVTKIKTLFYDLSAMVHMSRPTVKVLFDFWSQSLHNSSENDIDYSSFYQRLREKVGILLDEGVREGVIRPDWEEELPSILIGFFEGQLIQWLVDPSGPPMDDIKDTAFNVVMDGLAA